MKEKLSNKGKKSKKHKELTKSSKKHSSKNNKKSTKDSNAKKGSNDIKKESNDIKKESKDNKKEYTLEEISKHKKKSDAWLAISGKVYDITKWIDNHPGGDIIMKGAGKDATKMFKAIGHSSDSTKILKTLYIGKLKN
jgi:cytochrome b involved in lipid metabolism